MRLKPENLDLPNFSDCMSLPLVSAVGFFVFKEIAFSILIPILTPYCKD